MTTAYNPRQIATDGPFTAERRWQHVLKALIGLSVTAAVMALMIALHTYRFEIVFVGVAIDAIAAIKETIRPTDPNPHTVSEHVLDWLTDTACYSVGAPLYFASQHDVAGAVLLAAALFAIYRACRHGARP